MQNSRTVAQTLLDETAHFRLFPLKIGFFKGVGGGPRNLILIGILLFLLLRSPCKNLKSYGNPLWGKSRGGKNKNTKRKKICKIVATFVFASSHGQRTHSARTKIPKIVATFICASSHGQRTHSGLQSQFHQISHYPVKVGLIGGVGGIPQISFSFDS